MKFTCSGQRAVLGVAAAFLIAAGVVGGVQKAEAAGPATTNVSITMPNIVILYTVQNVRIDFNDFDELGEEGPADKVITSDLLSSISGDVNVATDTATTPPGVVAVELQNAWAARGITSTGTMQLESVLTSANATTAGGSTITANTLTVDDGAAVGPASTITFNAPGFNALEFGDVNFNLNLLSVTEAGLHTGMSYTLELTAP